MSPGEGSTNGKRGFSEDADAVASPDPSTDNNKKRRTTGSGSRGVANLTPDQLAKKRANDREAQRAIRERTKNQIENLENKIRELTSQQPYQELQHVLRQKELVEIENADIKKRLATVLSLIQPILGQHGMCDIGISKDDDAVISNYSQVSKLLHRTPRQDRRIHYNGQIPQTDICPSQIIQDLQVGHPGSHNGKLQVPPWARNNEPFHRYRIRKLSN